MKPSAPRWNAESSTTSPTRAKSWSWTIISIPLKTSGWGFRIGQKRNVQVHKFVTTGTLEEMIDDMIESKKGLAQAVVGSSENWITEMSTDELRKVVSLRR